MKSILLATCLLLGLASSTPTPAQKPQLVITKKFFSDERAVYSSQHEIVNLLVPLNSLNFEDDEARDVKTKKTYKNINVFFTEADTDDLGKRTYKGLYILKDGVVTKILENGVDAAASADDSKTVYLAATDGIYVYSPEHQTPVKYGSISDNVIGIAHEAESEVFYILTADHSVYKVLDNGNKKEKLEDVSDAQQIVLDYSNNLYFYTSDKKAYVKTAEGVKEVVGLPENPSKFTLVKPPIVFEEGVISVADGDVYHIYNNATTYVPGLRFEAMPSSFGSEASVVIFYAYNKKIYQYDYQTLEEKLEELQTYSNDKTDDIQALAYQRRQALRKKA